MNLVFPGALAGPTLLPNVPTSLSGLLCERFRRQELEQKDVQREPPRGQETFNAINGHRLDLQPLLWWVATSAKLAILRRGEILMIPL